MKFKNEQAIVESLLFAAGDDGLSLKQLSEVMTIQRDVLLEVLENLRLKYQSDDSSGIQLIELANSYQLTTKAQYADYLQKLVDSPHASALTQASLETLAIIAYKQPVTRIEIEEIRGVSADGPVRTLVSRGLITDKGRSEKVGRARLYVTTKEFLDYFGLANLNELPDVSEEWENDKLQEEMDLFFKTFQDTTIKGRVEDGKTTKSNS
ncbi:SMC-Scp complex subunit ScpB [Brochothrix campestris]|uniref:Segregation and condensation protein B n=1 Tax=Brochothrix campestris FSL F6-1037 TaxID=1265861 RepID=W7CPQ1_9LIST|nr:SMC-Scp complex subunit ScpB [Brochothrix campestris]EUJ41634.1 segregation and condensation protein B [Brochothrix campestris FSL F6-1037]